MLNNKNNIISSLNIIMTLFSSYGQTWRLSFHPIYSLVMLIGIGICVVAANWQFTKSEFYLAPIAKSVHVNGQYLNEYTHYLDNQTLNGKAGYAVITPFKYEKTIYLVNRGFIAYESRNALPEVESINETVEITGFLKAYKKPMLLNDSLQDPLFLRIQYINHKQFSMMHELPVAEKILHITSGPGLINAFPDTDPYLSQHRHMGYALQWFLLALSGLVIWLIASIKRGNNNE